MKHETGAEDADAPTAPGTLSDPRTWTALGGVMGEEEEERGYRYGVLLISRAAENALVL